MIVEPMLDAVRLAAILLRRWPYWLVAPRHLANALGKPVWIDWRHPALTDAILEGDPVWIGAIHSCLCVLVQIAACCAPILALLHSRHAIVTQPLWADELLIDWPPTSFAPHMVFGARYTPPLFDSTQLWDFVMAFWTYLAHYTTTLVPYPRPTIPLS